MHQPHLQPSLLRLNSLSGNQFQQSAHSHHRSHGSGELMMPTGCGDSQTPKSLATLRRKQPRHHSATEVVIAVALQRGAPSNDSGSSGHTMKTENTAPATISAHPLVLVCAEQTKTRSLVALQIL